MPWKKSSVVLERQRFALAALRASKAFVGLCVDYEISRKTGYKWLARYVEGGVAALGDRSRRPKRCAREQPACWKRRVRQVRLLRPHWGAKKIRARLRELYPRQRLPALSTVSRWLYELGLIGWRPRRARRGPLVPHPGLTSARRLHHVWTVDFKGWFCTADGHHHHPLTVREAHSRYLLEIRLLAAQSEEAVRRVMARLFRQHGLPQAIRVDNGSPFGGKGALGLSRLSVWWLRLGIRVEFTRRARPGDNAAHEQMHGRYKMETLQPAAANRSAQQRRTDRWRHDYNHHRPHEALDQKYPALGYARSKRRCPQSWPALEYPKSFGVRRVRSHGDIQWRGQLRFIGRAFVGQIVGLKPLSSHHWAVRLGALLIGELHAKDPTGLRPARWLRLPEKPLKV